MRRLMRLAGVATSGGFSALLIARVLALGNAFAVSVALLWAFGLPAAGVYALASFPAAAASLVSTLGFANALPRLALDDGERAAIALTVWLLVLPALAFACAVYGAALGRDWSEAEAIAMFAWGGGMLGQLGTQQMLLVLQGRTRWAPLASAVHFAGIGAALLAPDLERFALVLTAARLLGCLLGFAPLSFSGFRSGQLTRAVREERNCSPGSDRDGQRDGVRTNPGDVPATGRARPVRFGATVCDRGRHPRLVVRAGELPDDGLRRRRGRRKSLARQNEVIAWWTAAAASRSPRL